MLNIVQILEKNSQKQHQNNSFSENPFSEKSEEKTINLNISNNFLLMKLLEGFLKESYVSTEEDKMRKKRKYRISGRKASSGTRTEKFCSRISGKMC